MRLLFPFFLFLIPVTEVAAIEITAPSVPKAAQQWMPGNTTSFAEGLSEMVQSAVSLVRPELREASQVSVSILATVILLSIARNFLGTYKRTVDFAGAASVAVVLMKNSTTMVRLGIDTIRELSNYGKLLFPVMTTAMAANGAATTSAALYVGTSVLNLILSGLVSDFLIPGIYLLLAVSATYAATRETLLKRIKDTIKKAISWVLKILLTVFTTYMSITGVVSGTTDAAALKATKLTISTFVPVVGGILSDASDAVLVSAGLLKNAAGIYGILAILAICMEPFLKTGVLYLIMKAVASLCSVIEGDTIAGFVDDVSSAMGLLLAMTGSVCILLLISTVCFMKGFGS